MACRRRTAPGRGPPGRRRRPLRVLQGPCRRKVRARRCRRAARGDGRRRHLRDHGPEVERRPYHVPPLRAGG
eukprot:8742041-Lingulodinium_polyedra.AAC.1